MHFLANLFFSVSILLKLFTVIVCICGMKMLFTDVLSLYISSQIHIIDEKQAAWNHTEESVKA